MGHESWVMRHANSISRVMWVAFLCMMAFANAALAQVRVVTTLPVLADLARQVGGEYVSVRALAKPNEDPHYVIPRPSLMAAVSEADLFVEVGMSLELWTARLLDSAGNPNVAPGRPGYVYASTGVSILETPAQLSRAQGDVHPEGNPHVWLDPDNAVILARNIRDGLMRVDPEHGDAYARNFDALRQSLERKREEWVSRAQKLGHVKFVSYHREWSYFANAFGFVFAGTIEEKPGIPPSAAHRDRLIAQMSADSVPLIVLAPFSPRRVAEQIAEQSGARLVDVPLDVGSRPDASDYTSLIDAIFLGLEK